MKIDYAIMSSNDNPLYLDFWDIVAPLWNRLGITPVLLYFGEHRPKNNGGVIVNMDTLVENEPLATCWSRYWYASTLKDKIGIITDIDMLPLSNWYFVEQIANIDIDKYVHINPCIEEYSRYPSCYHIAKGITFKEVFNSFDTFQDDYTTLLRYAKYMKYEFKEVQNKLWCFDEHYATECINLMDKENLILLKRSGGINGNRIDRDNWKYDTNRINEYYDCHSIRPYSKYKKQIDELISLIK